MVPVFLALILCSGLYLLSTPVATAMPLDTIKGFVLDEDGNPVPRANVSLWQNGTLVPYGLGNPQQSRFYDMLATIPSSREYVGMFWFGMIYPGEYTIRAEKRGHVGTTTANVTVVEVHYAFVANVTIPGYHVPVLTPEQRNLTGGVAGTIRYADGTRAYNVNVTLWQNGDMVERPGNPQLSGTRNVDGREVDYLFDHLAPGQYYVEIESSAARGKTESVPVNVTDNPVMADIALSYLYSPVPPGPGTLSPSPPPSSTAAGIGTLLALSSIGVAAMLISTRRRSR
jgi:hypothetical protein